MKVAKEIRKDAVFYDEIAEATGKTLVFHNGSLDLIGRFDNFQDAYNFCRLNGYDYLDLHFMYL